MTNPLLEKFEALKRAYPNGNVDDIIETAVMSLEGTLPSITPATIEHERKQLATLERGMRMYEIAEFLLDTAGPEAVGTALKRIEAQEQHNPTLAWAMKNPQTYQEKEEEDMENDELLDAIEETIENGDDDDLQDLLEKLKARRRIRLGVHSSKISDNRLRSNKPVRDFHALVNKPINDFNRLANLHHESVSDEEFQVLAENVLNEDDSDNIVSENTSFRIRNIMVQKAAEKRDRENAAKNRTTFLRNRLANEAQSQNFNRTAAAKTIVPHSVRSQLPSEFSEPWRTYKPVAMTNKSPALPGQVPADTANKRTATQIGEYPYRDQERYSVQDDRDSFNDVRSNPQQPSSGDVMNTDIAMRWGGQDRDVRSSLPAEFAPNDKVAASNQYLDQVAANQKKHVRGWTDAARTQRVQPNHEKSPADGKTYGPNAPGFLDVDGMTQQEVVPADDASSGMSGLDSLKRQPSNQGQTKVNANKLTARLPKNGR